jgi:hypothetical protein
MVGREPTRAEQLLVWINDLNRRGQRHRRNLA